MVFSCITFSCIIQMVYMCYWPHTLKPRKDQYVLSRSVDLLNVSTAVVDLDDWTVHVTYIDITVDFAFLRTACNFRGFIVTNSDTKSPRPNCILRVRTSSPRPYPVSPRSIMWPKRLIFFSATQVAGLLAWITYICGVSFTLKGMLNMYV